MVPWRPSRVASTQSNMSTPRAIALDEAERVAHAHEVAGLVGGQRAGDGLERRQHLVARLAHREPADAVAVEADLDRARRALGPQRQVDAALHDAELGLAALRRVAPASRPARKAGRARRAHAAVRSTAVRTTSLGGGQGRAHVEHHLDVGAELALDLDRRLRA